MINHKGLRLTKLALALSIALAAGLPASAQNTSSNINGRIVGSDGRPASGATVTIRHNESGSVNTLTTDAEGRYSARGLRVGGPYTITITKDGVTEKREGIYLQLAETASVDAQLGAMQTVTIAGQANNETFNRTTMGAGTSIGRGQLAALASINRSLSDYARLDPRLAQTDKDRGEISAAGQNARFNSITIDGVSISDTFGLEANGLPTNKQPISIDSIASVQVNISNYDVTQKGYTGANINAVTKSGTNDFPGSVYHVYRNDKMSGDRYNTTDNTSYAPPTFTEKTTGVTLGGALIQDKLFIFFSGEDSFSSRASPSFGPLGSGLTNVGITPSAIAGVQQISQNKWGFDAGTADTPTGLAQRVQDRLVKLDWNITDDHRAVLRWQRTIQNEPQFSGYNDKAISLRSYLWSERKDIQSTVVQLFSDWRSDFSTELKLSRRDTGKKNFNNAYLPSVGVSFTGPLPAGTPSTVATGTRFINFGTEISRQANELETTAYDAYLGATWLRGDHELKFGGDYKQDKMSNVFLQNVNGSYTFGCTNTNSQFVYTVGPVDCAKSPAEVIEAAVLENYRLGRPNQYTAQMLWPGVTLADTAAAWKLANTGLFLQDTWSASPNLTLTYGVRYDRASTSNRPRANAALAAPTVAGVYNTVPSKIVRETGGLGLDNTITVDGDDLIQPRFGFNYRFDSKRSMQLRGGVGLFEGSALNVWIGNPFANPGVLTYVQGCGGIYPACNGTSIFNPDPTAQPVVGPRTSLVDVLERGLSQPSVWKGNLAFEHQLPWYGLVASVEYLRTQTRTGLYFKNLNLGAPTRIGPDGREMFWTETGYTASCANGTGGFSTSGACAGHRNRALSNAAYSNVIQVSETKKGSGNVATVSIGNPGAKSLRWNLAYTFTDAEEVSNLSSSTAASNWSGRAIFNPNEETLAPSSYAIRNRVTGMLTWEKRFFGNYKTTVGAFYEGRSGKPYSWTFNNDLNGDGTGGNDLMYIPKAPGSGEVVFRGDSATSHANEDRFWEVVRANPGLASAVGGVTSRQGSRGPWTNSIDLRLSQEVPGFWKGHKGALVLDFMNVGNMFNKRWGRIYEGTFSSSGGNSRNFVDYAGMQDGKYVYQVRDQVEDFQLKQNKGESQWAIQATVRYEF
ncbi:MAG: TonB-dependent receptor domain-containing protein [Gammaproteobacteria bacterium]